MKKKFEQVSWCEFIRRYCETQDQTPEGLQEILKKQEETYNPYGFFMGRCDLLDSSYFGSRVILPFGPNNTFKEPPEGPFTLRGLASDTSSVECVYICPLQENDYKLPE